MLHIYVRVSSHLLEHKQCNINHSLKKNGFLYPSNLQLQMLLLEPLLILFWSFLSILRVPYMCMMKYPMYLSFPPPTPPMHSQHSPFELQLEFLINTSGWSHLYQSIELAVVESPRNNYSSPTPSNFWLGFVHVTTLL